MALESYQKGFYDSRRQFQGKDDPDVPAAPPPVTGGIPRSQLVIGMLFLVLIAVGFYFFAIPHKPTPPSQRPVPTTPVPHRP